MSNARGLPAKEQTDSRAELGKAPIGRLLFRMALPATVAMVVNGLYNLVDTIYVGRGIGTTAVGGLSVALPAQMIVMAIGISIGQGAASTVSRNLGSGNDERAQVAAGNAFALALSVGLVILVLGQAFLDPLLTLLGATEALRGDAESYLRVILLGSPFIALAMVSNNLLRSEGKARVSMTVMLIGAVTNIILDPLFIFVFRLGVGGAAWATVIGQFFAFLYASRFFVLGRTIVRVKPEHWVPRFDVIREILVLGFPVFLRQAGQGLVSIFLNRGLGYWGGDLHISAFGIVNRLLMFLFMPLFGTVQGFQPIAGFNWGAGLHQRVRESLRLAIIVATVYTTAGFLLLFSIPSVFIGAFTADPVLVATAVRVLRHVVALFPLMGMQIVGAAFFLAIGQPLPGLVLNLSRQFLLLIPLILILPSFWGLNGILVSFPIADLAAALITALWLYLGLKTLGIRPVR